MDKIAVQNCNTYQEDRLTLKIERLIDLLGGIESFVKPGQKVLLKVNLLMSKSPERAITTHPALVKAVGKLVQRAGGIVIIGDSPGGLFSKKRLEKAYQRSGLTDVAREIGASLNYEIGEEKVDFPEGDVSKSFILAKYVTEADVIINLPKLKTHGLTMYTGAVKNLFGTIPGLLKAEYHLKMARIDLFTRMLIDLFLTIKPELNIMDAVIGMEGDGPSGGEPRKFSYLLASTSALALDIAGIYLMGINPMTKVPLMTVARERGLISAIDDLDFCGDELVPAENVKIPVIEKSSNLLDQKVPRPISNILDYLLRPRPIFNHEKCIGCGDCFTNCPAKTIEMVNHRPVVKLDNCIRCFCCQELCQYGAVEIKRPLLNKLLIN